ncbi:hypothetical protein [Kitasatospora sp. NPDC059599]|uniref:hypothetical protein n=1 Tax=Kitasatospora sp. NPDC059599 TaxID=3346880 RepID=UPI0036A64B7D
MADKNSGSGGPSGIGDRPQDDFVARNLSDPSERPPRTLTLSGLLGDSDRTGFRRLYFNKQLDYYAEFASADVLSAETVDSDRPPFVGLDATKVTLRRDATVHFTRVAQATPVDEFDLDLRLGPRRAGTVPTKQPAEPQTWEAECPGPTFGDCVTEFACATDVDCPTAITVCKPRTCHVTENGTCETCVGATCENTCFQQTCATCGENTCVTCGGATCRTCDRAATCVTCITCATCREATCVTCRGQTCVTCDRATCDTCHGATCITCDTCNPHVFTCGPNPQCRF